MVLREGTKMSKLIVWQAKPADDGTWGFLGSPETATEILSLKVTLYTFPNVKKEILFNFVP